MEKAQYGPAGLFNYLRSGQKAAPSVLPDVVVLNSHELWQAVELGLIQPLEAGTVIQFGDFYPFALQASTYRNQLYGVPYAVELLHVVGPRDRSLPATWAELLAQGAPQYLFQGAPADDELNASVLLHYVAAGAMLNDRRRRRRSPVAAL